MPPTDHQSRAWDMFQSMLSLPEDEHQLRATAVARCLEQEGIPVARGYFRQLRLASGSIVDIEVLEIEGALVDAHGIRADWQAVASDYLAAEKSWLDADPVQFSPQDPDWLGKRAAPQLELATQSLRALLDQQALLTATPAAGAALNRSSRRI